MKKILGVLYFLGSLLWCILLFPITIAIPLVQFFPFLLPNNFIESFPDFLLSDIKATFALLAAFLVIMFGLSILRSSINMIRGAKKEDSADRLRSLVEKKLNKSQNASTPSESDAA